MKSFCIKTNHKPIIDYLLTKLEEINIDTIYLSHRHFKIYDNIIIHYIGDNLSFFYHTFCDILMDCILNFYEENKLKSIINMNYFYFCDAEKKEILDNCLDFLQEDENIEKEIRLEHLYVALLSYITQNKSMILDGFVTFRLQNYIKLLDYVVDTSVNRYLIEKEYTEFIHLLQMYIRSKQPEVSTIHLLYKDGESVLFNEERQMISVTDNIFNAKYLSDISFSSNDYALNTLLTLLPQKIVVHILDKEDEFIHTLNLIFDQRVEICHHCSLCQSYQQILSAKLQP